MPQTATGDETRALLNTLNHQREHVLGILDGAEEDLHRPVLPSGWTCLGLVRHLAIDVERFWFRAVVAGEPIDLDTADDAWQAPTETFPDLLCRNLRRTIPHVTTETACHAGHLDATRELIDDHTWQILN